MRLSLIWVALCLPLAGLAQPTAEAALAASIAYHDPDGQWTRHRHTFSLRETRPDAADRLTEVVLDHPGAGFSMRSQRDGRLVEAARTSAGCEARIDGAADFDEALRERYRLSCDGIAWLQAYYGYLHSLPMNLLDAGTRLDPAVKTTTFNGQEVLQLRVTYDAAVGEDLWYFYLDPNTFALRGSRFYHDESQNDGEYLIFEDEVQAGTFRRPRTIRWYINADDRFLGADIIETYTVQ